MELQQAFDPKRLAISVLLHSFVYSLNVYGRICSRSLSRVPYSVSVASRSLWSYRMCLVSFVSCVCFAICFFGCFFRSGAFHAAALESPGRCSVVRR